MYSSALQTSAEDGDNSNNPTSSSSDGSGNGVDVQQQRQQNDGDASSITNGMSVWQAATLLTADCVGTGILALPNDMLVLGKAVGIGFLVLNLPINFYAGKLLADVALAVEEEKHGDDETDDFANDHDSSTDGCGDEQQAVRPLAVSFLCIARSHRITFRVITTTSTHV